MARAGFEGAGLQTIITGPEVLAPAAVAERQPAATTPAAAGRLAATGAAESATPTMQLESASAEDLLAIFGLGGDEEWQEKALCAQTDPEAFFPEKGGSTREAKRICRGCEVRGECLEYALNNGERFGIWGGLSERERNRLKRRAAS